MHEAHSEQCVLTVSYERRATGFFFEHWRGPEGPGHLSLQHKRYRYIYSKDLVKSKYYRIVPTFYIIDPTRNLEKAIRSSVTAVGIGERRAAACRHNLR
jgi:hypothetical protein